MAIIYHLHPFTTFQELAFFIACFRGQSVFLCYTWHNYATFQCGVFWPVSGRFNSLTPWLCRGQESSFLRHKPVRYLAEGPSLHRHYYINVYILLQWYHFPPFSKPSSFNLQFPYFPWDFGVSRALPMVQPSLASCGWYIGVASFGQPKCARHSPRSRNQRRVRLRAWRSSPDAMFGFGYSDNHRTHMNTYIDVCICICIIYIYVYIIYIYVCIYVYIYMYMYNIDDLHLYLCSYTRTGRGGSFQFLIFCAWLQPKQIGEIGSTWLVWLKLSCILIPGWAYLVPGYPECKGDYFPWHRP